MDFNGDGHLDLLVGDFGMSYGPKPKLTEQDKKVEKDAHAKMQEPQTKMQPFYHEHSKIIQPNANAKDSPEARSEREKKAAGVLKKKEYQALQTESTKVYETIRKFQRPYSHHGYVWLYLRQPTAAAAAAK